MNYFPPRARTTTVICLSLALLACSASEAPPEKSAGPAPAPAKVTAPAPQPLPEPAPVAQPDVPVSDAVVVRELTLGDRACYLKVESTQGEGREVMAVMELCERQELIGRTVLLTFETASIAAESCQGDPECKESETVQLVSDVQVQP